MHMFMFLLKSFQPMLSTPHINMAKPTAPPSTNTISRPKPRVMAASPVCKPGEPDEVPVDATPAVPDGVVSPVVPAGITVTAVMIDLLPFGKVLV